MNTAQQLPQFHSVKPIVNEVVCECGHRICDSEGVIRSRCVKIGEGIALCRCKRWVSVPVGNC
ncbi:hypothetical protein [Photobacterium salinisoli]|uniref:hypothetical protein n=1 Tax=Photobacterium salinisoli TaxID=1616783 RepID=UPI000EA3DDDE|nr:hypothetical protein [Photobacterium salinisoli]